MNCSKCNQKISFYESYEIENGERIHAECCKGDGRMDLIKMIEAQSELNNLIKKNKGLEDEQLIQDTFVALLVELGEFANEGRWFKFWSKNQEPRIKDKNWYFVQGTSKQYQEGDRIKFESDVYKKEDGNPLLEEYADGVHFFLSIAILKGWEKSLTIHDEAIMDLERDGLDGGLTGIYLELMFFLNMSHQGATKKIYGKPSNEYYFSMAWFLFIGMGMVGFGFTEEQIEQAYYEKNTINHERQANGY